MTVNYRQELVVLADPGARWFVLLYPDFSPFLISYILSSTFSSGFVSAQSLSFSLPFSHCQDLSTTVIMTGWSRAKEDRPTPPEVYNWRVYASALIVALGVMAYGYDSAFIGTTITEKSFERDFGLDKMTKAQKNNVSSNLTSICQFLRFCLRLPSW